MAHLTMVAVGVVLPWLTAGSTAGPALTALFSLLGGILALVFSLMYRRYLGILGAGARGKTTPERKAYDALRESLAGDNLAARLYAEWLTAFLDGVERFFGDAGAEGQRAFGLKKPAPLWTAPALDRCLLLALIYPIAAILLIWAVSGHVGPAEAALRLNPYISGWARGLFVGSTGLALFAGWRFALTQGWKWLAVAGAGTGANFFASAFAGAAAVIVPTLAVALAASITGLVIGAAFGAGAFIGAGAGVVAVAFAFAVAVASSLGAGVGVGSSVGAAAVAVAVMRLNSVATKYRWHGFFFSLFFPATILTCLANAAFVSHLEAWEFIGPMLLFLVSLTLLNAPFDWASLGLTRALLRRGLELGGWWPFLLALADAALAVGIIALLALVMVIGVQAFDELAVHGGGEQAAVLPLDKLFDGIAKSPAAPEYWWAYALLLSSMIPSLINLMIGGLALTRGIPGLPSVLLNFMPTGKAVPGFDRVWMALVLTAQIFVGAFLGIAAQALLAWGLIFHLMPAIGLDLLDMARAVAAFDFPARIGQLFAGFLALT